MALFRRMKSPRSEFRNTTTSGSGDGIADKPQQLTEAHKSGGKRGKRYSTSHRRHRSDELNNILEVSTEPPLFLSQTEEVEEPSVIVDYQLSDPLPPGIPPQLPPRHRGGSGGAFNLSRNLVRPSWRRTHSSGTVNMSSKTSQMPLQPPHQEYHVPVDTLRSVNRTSMHHQLNGAIGGPISHHLPTTQKEQRIKDMHERILAHNDPSLSKRKSRSMDKLLDTNDYSLPFDMVPGGTPQDHSAKSRSPEGPPLSHTGKHHHSSMSSTSLNMHSVKELGPVKPPRLASTSLSQSRNYNAPSFAPPPPPTESDLDITERSMLPPSPGILRKGDDYEEPWDSKRIHLPKHSSRRQRSETETKVTQNSIKSPKSHRSHTANHETSPEQEGMTLLPLRTSPRLRSDFSHSDTAISPSAQSDSSRPRTNTGEPSDDDYCIPPDAIGMHVHINNGVISSNGGGWLEGPGGGGKNKVHEYINQPPVPARISSTTTTNDLSKTKHGYPPLLPSDHYISDIQNFPPPLYPIDTSLHLEEQPWYHGRITRDQAEEILYNQPDFSFLVRKSESSKMDYSLSIRDRTSPAAQGFIHLKITLEKAGYVLGQFSAPFHSVPLCIAFYTQHQLTIKHINHRRLGFPVGKIKSISK